MKNPIFTLILCILTTLCLLIYDTILTQTWIEIIQNISFLLLGGIFSWQIKHNKKKANFLINTEKLALEVIQSENNQLKEKIKTLEKALDKIIK